MIQLCGITLNRTGELIFKIVTLSILSGLMLTGTIMMIVENGNQLSSVFSLGLTFFIIGVLCSLISMVCYCSGGCIFCSCKEYESLNSDGDFV